MALTASSADANSTSATPSVFSFSDGMTRRAMVPVCAKMRFSTPSSFAYLAMGILGRLSTTMTFPQSSL